jgi:hypothetical protein
MRRLLEGVMHPSGCWMLDFMLLLYHWLHSWEGCWRIHTSIGILDAGLHASIIFIGSISGKGLEMRDVHFRAARLSLSGQKACHVFCLFLEERLGNAFWCM